MRLIGTLALLLATLALAAAGCGGDEESGSGDADVTVTAPTETDGEETGSTDDDENEGDAANGELVFATAGCGGCHTLAAAGTNGSVGPNLDDASPSYDKIVERVTNGQGAMPSYEGDLTAQEIQDVAAYVSSSVS